MDLESDRTVTEDEGRKAAEKLGIPFMETSAKTGHNVLEAFQKLVREIPRSGVEYKVTAGARCVQLRCFGAVSKTFTSVADQFKRGLSCRFKTFSF